MTTPRPKCVRCQNVYGYRDTKVETVRFNRNEIEPPQYTGNGVIVRTTGARLHEGRTVINGVDVTGHKSCYRYIWDGATWIKPHDPFCTLRCALSYAREAYEKAIGGRSP